MWLGKKKKKEQLLVLAESQTFGVEFSVASSPGGSVEACKAGFPYWCDPVARRPLTWHLFSFIVKRPTLRKKRPSLIISVAEHNKRRDRQWALVHWAEGSEPSLEGGLGRAPPAKKENQKFALTGPFMGCFFFHYSPLSSNHINHLGSELQTSRKLVRWAAVKSQGFLPKQDPEDIPGFLPAPESPFLSSLNPEGWPASFLSSGATCYFQLLLSPSWSSVGQERASPLPAYLIHTNCGACRAHHATSLASVPPRKGFWLSGPPELSLALTARNRNSYQIMGTEYVIQVCPALWSLCSSWDRHHLSSSPPSSEECSCLKSWHSRETEGRGSGVLRLASGSSKFEASQTEPNLPNLRSEIMSTIKPYLKKKKKNCVRAFTKQPNKTDRWQMLPQTCAGKSPW